jgi:RNA polymerase sigma-70 factor (ECF subfamily)
VIEPTGPFPARLSLQMQPDDAMLVRQAAGGDETAFRLLVDRHSRSVFRLAFRITGTREDAEDVVQDTFIRAFRQLDRFESRSNFGTWLYRIGFNCAIDFTRSRVRRETAEPPDVLDQREDPAATPTGHDVVYAGQISVQVQRALRALSDQERAAFVMRHYHQCSIDEIGRTLDLKTSAAKHAVFRAVRKMRAALRPLVTSQGEGT